METDATDYKTLWKMAVCEYWHKSNNGVEILMKNVMRWQYFRWQWMNFVIHSWQNGNDEIWHMRSVRGIFGKKQQKKTWKKRTTTGTKKMDKKNMRS